METFQIYGNILWYFWVVLYYYNSTWIRQGIVQALVHDLLFSSSFELADIQYIKTHLPSFLFSSLPQVESISISALPNHKAPLMRPFLASTSSTAAGSANQPEMQGSATTPSYGASCPVDLDDLENDPAFDPTNLPDIVLPSSFQDSQPPVQVPSGVPIDWDDLQRHPAFDPTYLPDHFLSETLDAHVRTNRTQAMLFARREQNYSRKIPTLSTSPYSAHGDANAERAASTTTVSAEKLVLLFFYYSIL